MVILVMKHKRVTQQLHIKVYSKMCKESDDANTMVALSEERRKHSNRKWRYLLRNQITWEFYLRRDR